MLPGRTGEAAAVARNRFNRVRRRAPTRAQLPVDPPDRGVLPPRLLNIDRLVACRALFLRMSLPGPHAVPAPRLPSHPGQTMRADADCSGAAAHAERVPELLGACSPDRLTTASRASSWEIRARCRRRARRVGSDASYHPMHHAARARAATRQGRHANWVFIPVPDGGLGSFRGLHS